MAETNDHLNAYRLRELSDGLDRLAELARELHADPPPLARSPETSIDAAWAVAPLALRLKFVRDILQVESALQPVLRQASALEELRLRGDELDTWLMRYPTLFADAIMLLTDNGATGNGSAAEEIDPAAMLAANTLAEARETLDRELTVYGIHWISSAGGEPITSDHEVVGEEPSHYPKATIARGVRPGFRHQDKLELPAQVVRSTGPAITPDADVLTPNTQHLTPNSQHPTPNALHPTPDLNQPPHLTSPASGEEPVDLTPNTQYPTPPSPDPEWLVILGQRTHGCDVEPVNELIWQLRELVATVEQPKSLESCEDRNAQLASLLAPLVSILGMRYADSIPEVGEEWGAALLDSREPILLWLRETLTVELISPQRGDRFDEAVMEAVETRRTVHANEIETVARAERMGLMRAGSPMLRALVVRYIAGIE